MSYFILSLVSFVIGFVVAAKFKDNIIIGSNNRVNNNIRD